MPGRITELSETQIVADILKDLRRQARALTEVQVPQPAKDTFTVAATPATTYQLNAIPYQGSGGSSLNLSLNGVELVEGVDYTCDYTTALVTVTATLTGTPTPADVLTADYWTTGDLIAFTGPADTGDPPTFKSTTSAATTGDTPVTSLSVSSPTCAAGDLLLLAFQVNGATGSGTPSGWSLVTSVVAGPTAGGYNGNYYLYTKTATSTDAAGTTYTASCASSAQVTIACLSYTPGSVDVSATNGAASGSSQLVFSWNCPTVTVTNPRTIVEFWALSVAGTNGSFSGPGTPVTIRANASVSGGTTNSHFTVQRAVDEPQAAAGTTTARTVTCGLGGAWASITVALKA